MTLDIEEFREYLKIDKLGLDDDLRHQPSLLFKVSETYEKALADRDHFKAELTHNEAMLDESFRASLDAKKIKYTETQIRSLVLTDSNRMQNYRRYVKARIAAGQLNALRDAFKERGYMLRELCGLYVSNYFERDSSRPTPDSDRVVYEARKAKMQAVRERS